MNPLKIMGAVSGLIGLAASGVAGWFFLLGLQQTEHDPQARTALAVAGVLMTLAQMAAFALHGLLPARTEPRLRRTLLGLAVVLLAFEVLTMSLMQWATVRNADQAGKVAQEQAQQLRQMIDSQRATASALRDAAAVQARSIFPTSRQMGLQALADAARMEADLQPLLERLATTAAVPQATMIGVLGAREAAAFVVLRSVLISAIGLLMMSAAGRLLSRGDEIAQASLAVQHVDPTPVGSPGPQAVPDASEQEPCTTVPSAERSQDEPVSASDQAPLFSGMLSPIDRRYLEVRDGVLDGRIKPSVREIRAAVGGATASAQAYLSQLEADRIVQRRPAPKQGYVLVGQPDADPASAVEKSRACC